MKKLTELSMVDFVQLINCAADPQRKFYQPRAFKNEYHSRAQRASQSHAPERVIIKNPLNLSQKIKFLIICLRYSAYFTS